MAEAFAVAAGVFGVVSLSIQLGESIQKVKSFLADFKQASPRLAELVEEIGETHSLMKELEHQTKMTGAVTNPLICRCIGSSRRAVEYFAQVTSELEIYGKRHKMRGALKFALSQHELTRMLNRMERAKGLLVTACTQHLGAVQQQRYDTMIRGIERLASGQNDILQRMETTSIAQPPEYTTTVARMGCGRRLKRIFEVRTPEWMNNKIWELALDRSICGWQFTMRTYGVIPQNAPIIRACQNGNTVAMQRMFDTGAASPFDQTPEGLGLVSVSHHPDSQPLCILFTTCLMRS
jgi:hypothetical protein